LTYGQKCQLDDVLGWECFGPDQISRIIIAKDCLNQSMVYYFVCRL